MISDVGNDRSAKPTGRHAGTTTEWSSSAEEHLRVVHRIAKPADEVERALRIRPDRLVRIAYGFDVEAKTSAIISLSPFRSQHWLRVPARIEFSTPLPHHAGAVISLKWQASHLSHYFPVLEADLLVNQGTGTTDLELQGTYRPPLGIAGFMFDRLVGKRFAAAAAVGFVEALGDAIERDDSS